MEHNLSGSETSDRGEMVKIKITPNTAEHLVPKTIKQLNELKTEQKNLDYRPTNAMSVSASLMSAFAIFVVPYLIYQVLSKEEEKYILA